MAKQHFAGTISQKVILIYRNTFLIEKHNKVWHLPGGRLHKKETLLDGVVREIKEELNITISNPQFLQPLTFINRHNEQKFALVYYYHLSTLPEITIQQEELDAIKWITLSELETTNMYSEFKQAIKFFFNQQNT